MLSTTSPDVCQVFCKLLTRYHNSVTRTFQIYSFECMSVSQNRRKGKGCTTDPKSLHSSTETCLGFQGVSPGGRLLCGSYTGGLIETHRRTQTAFGLDGDVLLRAGGAVLCGKASGGLAGSSV